MFLTLDFFACCKWVCKAVFFPVFHHDKWKLCWSQRILTDRDSMNQVQASREYDPDHLTSLLLLCCIPFRSCASLNSAFTGLTKLHIFHRLIKAGPVTWSRSIAAISVQWIASEGLLWSRKHGVTSKGAQVTYRRGAPQPRLASLSAHPPAGPQQPATGNTLIIRHTQ